MATHPSRIHRPFVLFTLALALCLAPDPAAAEPVLTLSNAFVPFGLCMADLAPAEQVALCQKFGYSGLGLAGLNSDQIRTFSRLPAVQSGKFQIVSALWWFRYDQPIDATWLNGILDDAHSMGMALWVVADWEGGDRAAAIEKTTAQFEILADLCRAKGVSLVLYPHVGCVFETAEQAWELQQRLAKAGHAEVRISIHLCHELKRNNASSLTSIIAKVAPSLALATISGANLDTFSDTAHDYWSTAIMPLDMGTYDYLPYLKALAENGYTGPIELHTYGLKNPKDADYDHHLERSLETWLSVTKAKETVVQSLP